MKHMLILFTPIVTVSVLVATLASRLAWASTAPVGAVVAPSAPGAAIPQSGRVTPAILGLAVAFLTACVAFAVWLRHRARQAQAQRILQEKTAEIRQLAEKTNYELHIKDLAEALGISMTLAQEVMRVTGAHLLSTRTGGGLYQLPHIVEEKREPERADLGIPGLRATPDRAPAAPPESGAADKLRATRERGKQQPNPPGQA